MNTVRLQRQDSLCVSVPPAEPQIENAQRQGNRNFLAVTEGIPSNITCRANRGKPAADITWYLNSVQQTENTATTVVTEEGVKTKDAIGE